jgi:CubicO group peptidase (beta-lactamase class C family)
MSMFEPRDRTRRITVPTRLEDVESFGPEDDAAHAGVPGDGAQRIWHEARRLYQTGLYPALSLCVRRRGATIIRRAIGHTSGNEPGVPIDSIRQPVHYDTPFCLFSASKALTATVIHELDERGLIRMDDPIAEFIPEFGANGKKWVTVRHVLTHRAGIPNVAGTGDDVALLDKPEQIVDLLCRATPVSRPGRRLSYHAITGGFVLGEVVRRVTGQDIRSYFHERFAVPMGIPGLGYGVDPARINEVAVNATTGPEVPLLLRPIVQRALGIPFEEATRVSNLPIFLTSIVPAGNVVGNAWETARFFEMLEQEGELDGHQILQPRTVRRATVESAYLEVDFTLGVPIRYGLGYMLGGERLSLFGRRTRHAFGHLGFMNVFAWADPDRDTSVALLTSGKPFLTPHMLQINRLLETIGDVCRLDW